ncbi:hypothetical protein AC1031_003746 [Aphanomyces cochlioides]|nr:hypothetical protein AC1031_003746 [Aphanomyces cochlioides]
MHIKSCRSSSKAPRSSSVIAIQARSFEATSMSLYKTQLILRWIIRLYKNRGDGTMQVMSQLSLASTPIGADSVRTRMYSFIQLAQTEAGHDGPLSCEPDDSTLRSLN